MTWYSPHSERTYRSGTPLWETRNSKNVKIRTTSTIRTTIEGISALPLDDPSTVTVQLLESSFGGTVQRFFKVSVDAVYGYHLMLDLDVAARVIDNIGEAQTGTTESYDFLLYQIGFWRSCVPDFNPVPFSSRSRSSGLSPEEWALTPTPVLSTGIPADNRVLIPPLSMMTTAISSIVNPLGEIPHAWRSHTRWFERGYANHYPPPGEGNGWHVPTHTVLPHEYFIPSYWGDSSLNYLMFCRDWANDLASGKVVRVTGDSLWEKQILSEGEMDDLDGVLLAESSISPVLEDRGQMTAITETIVSTNVDCIPDGIIEIDVEVARYSDSVLIKVTVDGNYAYHLTARTTAAYYSMLYGIRSPGSNFYDGKNDMYYYDPNRNKAFLALPKEEDIYSWPMGDKYWDDSAFRSVYPVADFETNYPRFDPSPLVANHFVGLSLSDGTPQTLQASDTAVDISFIVNAIINSPLGEVPSTMSGKLEYSRGWPLYSNYIRPQLSGSPLAMVPDEIRYNNNWLMPHGSLITPTTPYSKSVITESAGTWTTNQFAPQSYEGVTFSWELYIETGSTKETRTITGNSPTELYLDADLSVFPNGTSQYRLRPSGDLFPPPEDIWTKIVHASQTVIDIETSGLYETVGSATVFATVDAL